MIPIEDKKTKTKGTINSLTENLYPFSKINKRVIKIVISQNVRFPATLNPKTDKTRKKLFSDVVLFFYRRYDIFLK